MMLRIPLLSVALVLVGYGAAPTIGGLSPAISATADNSVVTMVTLYTTTTPQALDNFTDTICINCVWHQVCDPGTHKADATSGGSYSNPHDDCIGNGHPYWCSGHPLCSAGLARAEQENVVVLALAALDGSTTALEQLRKGYPSLVRHNAQLDTYDVLRCDRSTAFVSIPIADEASAE